MHGEGGVHDEGGYGRSMRERYASYRNAFLFFSEMCWKAAESTHLRRAQNTNRYIARSTGDRPRDLTREQTGPSWEVGEVAVSPTDMWHHLLETDEPIEIELRAKNPAMTSTNV